jgi:hypothetical protein
MRIVYVDVYIRGFVYILSSLICTPLAIAITSESFGQLIVETEYCKCRYRDYQHKHRCVTRREGRCLVSVNQNLVPLSCSTVSSVFYLASGQKKKGGARQF